MTQRMLSRIWPHVPPAQRRRLIAQLSQMVTRRLDRPTPAEETPYEPDNAPDFSVFLSEGPTTQGKRMRLMKVFEI